MAFTGNSPQHSEHPVVFANAVSWRTPDNQPVLNRVTLALGLDRTGAVGANGSGKTTLARLLTGDLQPTEGHVHRAGSVVYLPQCFRYPPGAAVAHALGVKEKLSALARLTSGDGSAEDLEILDDDWSLEERIAGEFQRLGLAHLTLDRRVETLSGGEITRLALAALFLRRPDLLILDEPTNNLDRESRQALYTTLRDWQGGLFAVSHDRELLGLMDRIVELSGSGLRIYGGNFALYTAQRDTEAAAAQHDLADAAKQLRKNRIEVQATRERQDRRNSRGRKTRDSAGLPAVVLNSRRENSQITSARLADVSAAKVDSAQQALAAARMRVENREELHITLTPVDVPAGKLVLAMQGVSFRHAGGEAALFTEFNLRMVGPERVAVVGPNGSGKTTLIRLILGRLRPTSGSVHLGVNRVHVLDQKTPLDPNVSILANFRAWNPGVSQTDCRLTLARFLFRADQVHREVATLSGGEQCRAALACILSGVAPPQLLLLDEPTNHLDLASLANLEQALRQYTGALVVVSHDQTFLKQIGITRTMELCRPTGPTDRLLAASSDQGLAHHVGRLS